MRFELSKSDWLYPEHDGDRSYLLTNDRAGYSSMSILGSLRRQEHAFYMASKVSPTLKTVMVKGMEERVTIGGRQMRLSSQNYVQYTKNGTGYIYLEHFRWEDRPTWVYRVFGVTIRKSLVMEHGTQRLLCLYEVENGTGKQVTLDVDPQLMLEDKGNPIHKEAPYTNTYTKDRLTIEHAETKLYSGSNGSYMPMETVYIDDLYYAQDACDGRPSVGQVAVNHRWYMDSEAYSVTRLYLVYDSEPIGTMDYKEEWKRVVNEEKERLKRLVGDSKVVHPVAAQLVKATDQFIVWRESTKGHTIVAGYPFFGDWGRDTMIALSGCCLSTNRYELAKEMIETFLAYERNGLLPNMFPEEDNSPMYNTVDASLLLVIAIYDYYNATKDIDFIKACYPKLVQIIEAYRHGTDYGIKMDEDGLMMAGEKEWQLTWMDVRYGDILPTPRHGKPVEINAYWYNALKIMDEFSRLCYTDERNDYEQLADKVKKRFVEVFYMEDLGYLKDVITSDEQFKYTENQIRCNQVWALSLPYPLLNPHQSRAVLRVLYEHLYTPYGLRTLSPFDREFKPVCTGSHFSRDMAYHQGTVWPFPLGAYYRAVLKHSENLNQAIAQVEEGLSAIESMMREGCIGQIAEIYDGLTPGKSRGCYAQAWSVSEWLRVYEQLQTMQK